MPHDNDSRSRLEKAWARSCRPGQDGAGAGRLVQRRVGAHADDDEGAGGNKNMAGMRPPRLNAVHFWSTLCVVQPRLTRRAIHGVSWTWTVCRK